MVVALLLMMAGPAAADLAADLAAAERQVAAGQFQVAYDAYTALVWDYPDDDRVNFGLGQAAFGLGEYPHALAAFERVLMRNPRADRVRLEMGRTYAAMGQMPQARDEFQTVLSHNPPPGVRATIEQYLAGMEEGQRRWRLVGSLTGGWFYDDNVNLGVESNLVVLNGVSFTMADASRQQSDHGMVSAAGLNCDYKLDEAGVWRAGAGVVFYQKWHERQSNQDLAYNKLQLTLTREGQSTYLSLNVKNEDIDYDYYNLVDIVGTEPTLVWAVAPTVQLTTRGVLERRRNRVESGRTSGYRELGETARWVFMPQHELTLGVNVFRENAQTLKYDNNGWQVKAGAAATLPWWQMRLYGSAARRWTDYAAPSTAAAGNINRSDRQWVYVAGLTIPVPQLEGVHADYHVTLTRNDSNTAIHSYRRAQHEGTLGLSF